jgi:hypothetical protein
MSFRSALSSPSPSSGGVGTVVTVQNLALALPTATNVTVASAQLSKGVWAVQASTLFSIPAATTVTEIWHNIFGGVLVPPATQAPNQYSRTYSEPLLATVSAGAKSQQLTKTAFVTVTDDDFTIQNEMRMAYTGVSGVTIDVFPNNQYGQGALYCVKIA